MTDTRPKAMEKARQRATAQAKTPNTGFTAEREKAKQALRDEIGSQAGQNVHKFAARIGTEDDNRILRVAAYCRVSTDDIDQVISIELQKNNYRDMIKGNPKWKYAGTYVDDGFSGTNTEHRPAFRLMMKDAMAGKIDMIITKSVSRFARNLLDCIGWVRKLEEHDPPIPVFFEQEQLNTLASTSNIILFVLAMVAEEESHMKSEAMLLSLEWRLSRGRFLTPRLLGYDRVEVDDGHGGHKKVLRINEEQAQTVRLMYYMLLSGSSMAEIAQTLTDLGRETGWQRKDGSMNTRWTAGGIASVMRNERYCGDVLARKTWTPNFHDHKSKKNKGKKNKYYQPAHHEAIVTRAQWNAAQRILNSHRYAHNGGYLPMRVIDHGILCGYISINRSWAGFEPDEYYRISSIAMGLEDGDLEANLENELLPEGGHKLAALTDDNGVQRIARELSDMEKAVKAQMEGRSVEEDDADGLKPVKEGFQVVSMELFSQAMEPVVRITRRSITFNSICIGKLNKVLQEQGSLGIERCRYVEMLFNPVERMLVVRPCAADHPNAVKWAKDDGQSANLGASAFCNILFSLMGWNPDYSYRVHAVVHSSNGNSVLFFDLDDYIAIVHRKENTAQARAEEAKMIADEQEDTKGFFYAADDEEPQEVEDIEAMEKKLRRITEIEKRFFGTPAFEHNSDLRIQQPDDENEWSLLTQARALDADHRVDDEIVEALQDKLLDAACVLATDPDGAGDPS